LRREKFDAARFGYPKTHTLCQVTNEGFAFNEGWAECWAGTPATCGDGTNFNQEGNVATALTGLEKCASRPTMVRVLKESPGSSSALVLTGSAEASGRAATTVSIKGQNGDYSGTIYSPRLHKCADQRTITVYRQIGPAQDPSVDVEIGSDTSELHGHHGEWSIGNSGFRSGTFYARAAKMPGCRAGSSRSIRR
jgi:hypothetical protein